MFANVFVYETLRIEIQNFKLKMKKEQKQQNNTKLSNVLYTLLWFVRFVIGWCVWFITAILSAILSLVTLTIREVGYEQNMETVINNLLGKSVWKAMFLNKP